MKPAALRLFVVLFLIFAVQASAAQADCLNECLEKRGCAQDDQSRECGKFKAVCQNQCSESATSFGAIAYDQQSGAYAMSDPAPSEEIAIQSAIRYCAQYGSNCAIVSSFSNMCAAVAAANNGIVTWAQAVTINEAQSQAQEACQQQAQVACEIPVSHCYFP